MVKITMEGSKAVLFLMLILGCFMLPTHSRNVVHVCPCQIGTCATGSSEAVCYCCSQDNCYSTNENCLRNCRCPPKSMRP
ncbi:hypothetical protein BDA96_08G158700 [Sorghum bicolor]|uniref:Uncharacterized protein n=2 Tax=Sorghum bicolor TaxID=4558 RepID=A0A921QIH2_SORBI|nr:hypothetical protein BDA96_08G158700 [Sorghum bicolor]KXG23811.1 hypothetical protein SORBI_3008G143200 [Sorghum bicolor]